MRSCICILATALMCCSTGGLANAQSTDRLAEALADLGLTRSDLGTRPQGYWTRFPRLPEVPHLLPSFPGLFAEPLRIYDFGRTMGNAAEIYLDPAYPDTPSAVFNLIYFLGVEKRVGGFRNYTTNLIDTLAVGRPLEYALSKLWQRKGELLTYRAFGTRAEWPGSPDSLVAHFAAAVPADLHQPLALLIANIDEALHWRDIGLRNIPPQLRQRLFEIRDLADTQGDGTRYYPELDDIAAAVDEQSLYYACMKLAAASDQLVRRLDAMIREGPGLPGSREFAGVDIETPFGAIRVGGSAANRYDGPALLILDLGGDDEYTGAVAASVSDRQPFGLVLDVRGDDRYGPTAEPAQGAGVLGCGMVYDAGGNDSYTALDCAQGFGLFGLGVVYDRAGNDGFEMHVSGQGCGYFGIGLLLDGGGKDEYRIWAEGQGQGGVGGGVGVLAARGGDDLYYAEPDAEVAGRADYHSAGKIAANNVQGSGNGRRGDGSDGHAWAGGLGALLDIGGSDRYESGNWSLGIGYWFGTGILFDSEGDDVYRSVYFTQASGAHFCNAALIDEAGDDRHELWFNHGAAIAFGWDYTNALLIDKAGDDFYGGGQSCVGVSSGRSHVLLYDGQGDDEYRLMKGSAGFGEASPRDDFFRPSPVAPYMYYSRSSGVLLDCDGRDRYLRVDSTANTVQPDSLAADGTHWRNPPNAAGALFGGGFDFPDGTVPDFNAWDEP